MAKANASWTVLPHRPIEKLDDRVWRVEGDLPSGPLKRVMTIAKRADGSLVVHNGIALDDAAMKEIDAWGDVLWIIVPNGFHRLDAKVFHDRYPNAKVICPSGVRAKVEEVVPVGGTYEDFAKDDAVSIEYVDGTASREGILAVKGSSGTTLVFNDALFNMPDVPGFTGFVLKSLTQSTGGPRVSRISRLFLIKDKAKFRAQLTRLADTPGLVRAIVSHHEVIDRDPAKVLREVAATL
jgi:hypothetical protein